MSNIEVPYSQKKGIVGPPIAIQFHLADGQVKKITLADVQTKDMQWHVYAIYADTNLEARLEAWLIQYGKGLQPAVTLPLDLTSLSPFTRDVLEVIQTIPFGGTLSYLQVAQLLQRPHAARAVGGACRRNPFPLLIPCHRVLDSKQSLRGYSGGGGLFTKKCLLDFEARHKKVQ